MNTQNGLDDRAALLGRHNQESATRRRIILELSRYPVDTIDADTTPILGGELRLYPRELRVVCSYECAEELLSSIVLGSLHHHCKKLSNVIRVLRFVFAALVTPPTLVVRHSWAKNN